VSVTKASLKALQREKLAQASLARIYATVRHFACYLHRKFPNLFPLGCPTEGVKPPAEPTADWKDLTRLDEIRLTAAAQTLRAAMARHEPVEQINTSNEHEPLAHGAHHLSYQYGVSSDSTGVRALGFTPPRL